DGGTVAFSNVLALGIAGGSGFNNEVIIDNGTLKYLGSANASLGRAPIFNPGGATVDVASGTNEFTLNQAAIGPGGLTKAGAGTLILNNANSTFSGNTLVNQGTLRLTAAGLSGGTLTMQSGTILQFANNITVTNPVSIPSGSIGLQVSAP